MFTVLKREISGGMSSLLGYVSICVFLIACSLVLWVYPESSILESGYASLQGFFDTVPWIFIFLVPAITMRLFADEKKSGTLELLFTRPISDWGIILGKYLAACIHILFALIPTLIYVLCIARLGNPPGNLDWGALFGSYLGLIFLGAVFSAIGLFCSSLTSNQVIAFLLAVLLCFFFFSGFDSLSKINSLLGIELFIVQLGINAHYLSVSRGVLDTRDLIYFVSISVFFLYLTKISLESRKW